MTCSDEWLSRRKVESSPTPRYLGFTEHFGCRLPDSPLDVAKVPFHVTAPREGNCLVKCLVDAPDAQWQRAEKIGAVKCAVRVTLQQIDGFEAFSNRQARVPS